MAIRVERKSPLALRPMAIPAAATGERWAERDSENPVVLSRIKSRVGISRLSRAALMRAGLRFMPSAAARATTGSRWEISEVMKGPAPLSTPAKKSGSEVAMMRSRKAGLRLCPGPPPLPGRGAG